MKIKHAILMAIIPSFVMAADRSGTCGEGCTWEVTGTALTITGTGDNAVIKDYQYEAKPWGNKIESVKITGIKMIGALAFANSPYLKDVDMSDSVEYIRYSAFSGCHLLSKLVIPESVAGIESSVLRGTSVSSIFLNDSMFDENGYISVEFLTYSENVKDIYCSEQSMEKCLSLLNRAYTYNQMGEKIYLKDLDTIALKSYTKQSDRYVLDGIKYKTLSDMQKQIPVKRIYTLEEAQARIKEIGKDHVTFRIRYK